MPVGRIPEDLERVNYSISSWEDGEQWTLVRPKRHQRWGEISQEGTVEDGTCVDRFVDWVVASWGVSLWCSLFLCGRKMSSVVEEGAWSSSDHKHRWMHVFWQRQMVSSVEDGWEWGTTKCRNHEVLEMQAWIGLDLRGISITADMCRCHGVEYMQSFNKYKMNNIRKLIASENVRIKSSGSQSLHAHSLGGRHLKRQWQQHYKGSQRQVEAL